MIREILEDETGAATAEYAIATIVPLSLLTHLRRIS